jgi:hypothetical protein
MPVYAPTHIQHHALGVGEQRKKRGASDGATQALYLGLRSLDKIALLL